MTGRVVAPGGQCSPKRLGVSMCPTPSHTMLKLTHIDGKRVLSLEEVVAGIQAKQRYDRQIASVVADVLIAEGENPRLWRL